MNMACVLQFSDVSFERSGRSILSHFSWAVDEGERWVLFGPNGAGKSTLLLIAAGREHPTSGTVSILGQQLGRVDLSELRPAIGFASRNVQRSIPQTETVEDAVLTAAYSVTGRWKEEYEEFDRARLAEVMQQWNIAHLAGRTFGTLSDGERQRVVIARAHMTDPELLLLDEPVANLDLGAREDILHLFARQASSHLAPTTVMVTHHLEEIPVGFTHMLLLSATGQALAQGPLEQVLTSEKLGEVFGRNFVIDMREGRYTARLAH